MPKTKNAFALRELWQRFVTGENFMTGEEFFLTVKDFSDYFNESRKATPSADYDFSQSFLRVDCALGALCQYSLPKTLSKDYDEAERTREELRGNERLIKRIERHCRRLDKLSKFEVKNKSRLEKLESRYQEISDVITDYQSALLNHYPTVISQVSKEFSRDFGKRLRRARRFKDISQDEISRDIALSQITISGYERGTREPTLYTLSRLAKKLGVSADYLLGLTDEPPKF